MTLIILLMLAAIVLGCAALALNEDRRNHIMEGRPVSVVVKYAPEVSLYSGLLLAFISGRIV